MSLLVGIGGLASSAPAAAWSPGDPDSPSAIDVHAFVSQGFIKSTGHDYLAEGSSDRGSFEFSEAGINFTSQLTDRFRVGMQLFAYDLGSLGKFDVRADWFYLDYHFKDWLGVRAGRLKLVYGLYNDISDIDAARVPVLLPESIYPQTNRYFLLGVNGAEIYGFVNLHAAGALEYRAIGGAIAIELPVSEIQLATLDVPTLAAGRLIWETPLDGLRIGVTGLALKANAGTVPTAMTPAIRVKEESQYILVLSAEYVGHGFLVAAEGMTARSPLTTDVPAPAATFTTVSGGWYGLVAYRINSWLQPGVYYSAAYPNWNVRSGPGNFQDDLSGTLRFDINNYWIVKLEGHYMHGTGIFGSTSTEAKLGPQNWGLFLLKTTAYF